MAKWTLYLERTVTQCKQPKHQCKTGQGMAKQILQLFFLNWCNSKGKENSIFAHFKKSISG